MFELMTGLQFFKTSGSNFLDLNTGVIIAILITIGKKPSLNEPFKIAFKCGKGTERSCLKSVHGMASSKDCLFARFVIILITSSFVTSVKYSNAA